MRRWWDRLMTDEAAFASQMTALKRGVVLALSAASVVLADGTFSALDGIAVLTAFLGGAIYAGERNP